MSTTDYNLDNQQFSDAAHRLSVEEIYPQIFGCDKSAITVRDMNVHDGGIGAIYDGQLAIDKLVTLFVPHLQAPLTFSVQERFQRLEFMKYASLTITEWNNNSNLPSELYKIKADFILYGYYDNKLQSLGRCIVVDASKLLRRIAMQSLTYTQRHNPRSNQTFLAFKFTDLHAAGVVIWDSVPQGIQPHLIA